MQGYVKLHRQIQDNKMWLREPFTRGQAWVDLILLANHKDGYIRVRGNRVEVKRGQVGWSEVRLAKRWKWSRGKVRRWFEELQKYDRNIVQQKNSVTSLITIKNYDEYQGNGTADGQQTDSRRYTNNNDKNDKENILYEKYVKTIFPKRKSRQRAIKNLTSILKTHSEDDLSKAIDNYSASALDHEPQYRKDPANFFGINEPFYRDFVPDNFQGETQTEILTQHHGQREL